MVVGFWHVVHVNTRYLRSIAYARGENMANRNGDYSVGRKKHNCTILEYQPQLHYTQVHHNCIIL